MAEHGMDWFCHLVPVIVGVTKLLHYVGYELLFNPINSHPFASSSHDLSSFRPPLAMGIKGFSHYYLLS